MLSPRFNFVSLANSLAFTRKQIAWAKRGVALSSLHNAPEPGRLAYEREAYGIILRKLQLVPSPLAVLASKEAA